MVVASCVLWSNLNRPLWIDEVVQFALAGMEFDQAVTTIVGTTGSGFNFSQTGFYYLLDWGLPNVLGASTLAVRLPSILCSALLLLAAVSIFRVLRLSLGWQIVLLGALTSTGSLMYFAGEARHYMPLAAFAVATFAFYIRRALGQLNATTWILGILGIWFGALWHPYWILFLLLALTFGYAMYIRNDAKQSPRESFRVFLTPSLVFPALTAYLIVAGFTWLKSTPALGNEPLGFMGSYGNLAKTLVSQHVGLARGNLAAIIFVIALTVIGILFAHRYLEKIWAPMTLMILGFGTSILFVIFSQTKGHWILQRQWTAGIAIFVIGLVWLKAEFDLLGRSNPDRKLRFVAFGFVGVTLVAFLLTVNDYWTARESHRDFWTELAKDVRSADELSMQATSNGDWVYLANLNVARGGAPWPELARFYQPN